MKGAKRCSSTLYFIALFRANLLCLFGLTGLDEKVGNQKVKNVPISNNRPRKCKSIFWKQRISVVKL